LTVGIKNKLTGHISSLLGRGKLFSSYVAASGAPRYHWHRHY